MPKIIIGNIKYFHFSRSGFFVLEKFTPPLSLSPEPVIDRSRRFRYLPHPNFLETRQAWNDTNCAFDGLDDDNLNATWLILRQMVRIRVENILDVAV